MYDKCTFKPIKLLAGYNGEYLMLTAINFAPLLILISAVLAVIFANGRKRQISLALALLTAFWMVVIQLVIPCDYVLLWPKGVLISGLFLPPLAILILCGVSFWMGMPRGRAWVDQIGIFATLTRVILLATQFYLYTLPHRKLEDQWIYIAVICVICVIFTASLPKRVGK